MNKMDRLRVGLLLLFLCPFLVVAKEVNLNSATLL